MKVSLLTLSLVFISSLAHADLVEDFQKNCQTTDVLKLIGETGACRVIIAPKKVQLKGSCVGNFGPLTCVVQYDSSLKAMNLNCGADANIDFPAAGLQFQVATLIKKADGQSLIINDETVYKQISSEALEINLKETLVDGVTSTASSMTITTGTGRLDFTEVVCI